MSQRAIVFVNNWISEHVHAEPIVTEKNDPRPKEFAARCRTEAIAEGISNKEIEEDCGPLEDIVAAALDEAADREVERIFDASA